MPRPHRVAGKQHPRPRRGSVKGPEVLHIELLGGFSVSVGSRTIEENEWRLRKAASLVKLLALTPTHRMHREQITNLLWPDLDESAAANNLHQALHVARRTLEPDPAAASRHPRLRGEQLELCLEGTMWTDVEAFEDAAASTRHGARNPAAYRAAIELYAGDLLPQDRYEAWAEERREELRRVYLSLFVELAGLYEERGEHAPAIEALGRAVAVEPAHEEAHMGLMRLYAGTGRRYQALRQYERLRQALRQELGAKPGATSRRLHEEILAERTPTELPSAGSPPEEPPGVEHNLPRSLTSFVGRERDVIEVERLLGTTRLLTLTGTGGSGKTRLALEAARDLAGAYPDEAWFVELASLAEGRWCRKRWPRRSR